MNIIIFLHEKKCVFSSPTVKCMDTSSCCYKGKNEVTH